MAKVALERWCRRMAKEKCPLFYVRGDYVKGMPALVLNAIPDSLHRRLQAAAQAHHRSLPQEAIHLLDRALDNSFEAESVTPYFSRRELLPGFAKLGKIGALAPRPCDKDITELISEDRR